VFSVAVDIQQWVYFALLPNYKIFHTALNNINVFRCSVGRDSSVGIATGYGLDGPGIESRWRRDFPHLSSSLLYIGYRIFPGGKERPGHYADPSPPSSAVVHERVELYLYPPYGPYGLYRASVPVQGCILPFTRT